MHDLAIFEDHTYSQFVRKPRYKLEVIIKAKPITFPLYWIAFRSGAKTHLSERNRYNFQKLRETTSSVAIIPLKIAFLKGTDRCFFTSLRKMSVRQNVFRQQNVRCTYKLDAHGYHFPSFPFTVMDDSKLAVYSRSSAFSETNTSLDLGKCYRELLRDKFLTRNERPRGWQTLN
jgi:hypothetical protein